ncbi:hypothetical protein [Phaffia rhodozyma]|uniref:Uncharacterized protein n=1 Tax=Phaffia rhodozyma TaxID=264483 RepID=A0A0F7SEM2_PHARH|nr:hypothetical protein [Phaffia rhodozyma]
MNTPQSVALGWGVLLVAASASYYYAKSDIDARRLDQQRKGLRQTQVLTWEERLKLDEQAAAAGLPPPPKPVTGGPTPANPVSDSAKVIPPPVGK